VPRRVRWVLSVVVTWFPYWIVGSCGIFSTVRR
jgi:hypothetical protein